MASPEVFNVSQSPVTSHAFNADRTRQFFSSREDQLVDFSFHTLKRRGRCQFEHERSPDPLTQWPRLDAIGDALRGEYSLDLSHHFWI